MTRLYLPNNPRDPRQLDLDTKLMADRASHLALLRRSQSKRGRWSIHSNGLEWAFPQRPDYQLPTLPPIETAQEQ